MPRPKFLPLPITIVVLASVISGTAQSNDRPAMLAKMTSLREQSQAKEKVFLAPIAGDVAPYAEFLQQPGTGVARLMPREKYDHKMLIRGGGAYYSFVRLTNEYGYGSEIGLEQGMLKVGFAGADFGFLTSLGDTPIEGVTMEQPGVRYLASLSTPSNEPEAREQQRRAGDGFEADGFFYRNRLRAATSTTYALRAVSYDDADVLVAFRVTRQDVDGSLILVWELLKTFAPGRFAPEDSQTTVAADATDRAALESEIFRLVEDLKATEQQYLAPSQKDLARYADFLTQPDTGLIRLLPRETFDTKMTIRGGAAYYSFARLTHEYDYGSDIELQRDQFSVGFAGADFGFLIQIGRVPIEEITINDPAAQFLATFVAPTTDAEAREQGRRSGAGFEVNGFTYKSRVPVKKKRAYLLRSIIFDYSDVLVAFRFVSRDFDDSVVIAWKILKRFPIPTLTRANANSR